MSKFRRKPVVIDAIQWDGSIESAAAIALWSHKEVLRCVVNSKIKEPRMIIHTLVGDMLANPGDWIIRAVKGDYYPCKDSIFRATYEPVES